MKFLKYMIPLLAFAFAACSDNDNSEEEPAVKPVSLSVTSSVPAQDEVIDAKGVYTVSVTYSAPVALNSSLQPTLNGKNVSARNEGDKLLLICPLEAGTQYTLRIPDRFVKTPDNKAYAPEFILNFSTSGAGKPEQPTFDAQLVTPQPMQAAKDLYQMLLDLQGKKIISGAMANVNNNNDFADWILKVSGKVPALTCYDFIHLADSPANWIDYSDISPARTQWQNGGIVSYMWHWQVPSNEQDYRNGNKSKYGFYIKSSDGASTDFDIREALKGGTWQNECILKDIDRVAEYFKLLQDAGIPVLWRPLHEAAGNYKYGAWFWWGRYGSHFTTQLWRLMYDRLVNHHGLKNLIWVWTAQAESGYEAQMKDCYPGDDVVDIVGVDLYEQTTTPNFEAYRMALDMTGGRKLVALSENGLVPDPKQCIENGAPWSWFMIWYTYNIHRTDKTKDDFGNTADWLREVMGSQFVLDRSALGQIRK